jgi:hypothetical protein
MTPKPSAKDFDTYHLYDPAPGTVHITDLINMAKDGHYLKDKLSDYVVGLLVVARQHDVITAAEGAMFQLPFVRGMVLRKKYPHYGLPLKDWNGKVLSLLDRRFEGSDAANVQPSSHDFSTFLSSPKFPLWAKTHLYAGRGKESLTYSRTTDSTMGETTKRVNSFPYAPGPGSIAMAAPGASGPSTPRKSKKGTRKTPVKTPGTKKPVRWGTSSARRGSKKGGTAKSKERVEDSDVEGGLSSTAEEACAHADMLADMDACLDKARASKAVDEENMSKGDSASDGDEVFGHLEIGRPLYENDDESDDEGEGEGEAADDGRSDTPGASDICMNPPLASPDSVGIC